jgi:tetratricopeptide (TPR) repeat protein
VKSALFRTLSISAPYPLVRNRYAFSTRAGVLSSPSRDGSSPSSASRFLIRFCILLFYLPAAAATAGTQSPSPDALYADRAHLASARRAAELWSSELARDPRAFDAAWKLARADYWLGGHAPAAEQRRDFEDGIAAGDKAIALEPKRPEGHFWKAANMGALAESFGLRQGLKYRTPIREELETVLRIDPAFQQGSADRALGRWYFKVPRLFGGSHKQAEQHLRASLGYNPNSTASHFFLAEVLLDDDRKAEAREELQRVLDAPLDPEWTPEDREFKEKASRLLASIHA